MKPTAVVLTMLAYAGCDGGTPSQPSSVTRAQPVPATEETNESMPTPQPSAPQPLPARFDVQIHLPGADAERHLNASMENWTLEGCVSDRAGACDKTRRFDVVMAARHEFIRIWEEVKATPRCEPEAQFPGDRRFQLAWLDQKHTGVLPAAIADITSRNQGPCRAHARLAMWFVQQFVP